MSWLHNLLWHNPAGRLLHNLAYGHTVAVREGLGAFRVCSLRLPPFPCRVSYQPALDGASWHRIPAVKDSRGVLLFERMMKTSSAYEAMALLRQELE